MEGYMHPDIYLRRSGPKHRWKSRKRSGRLHNRALLAAALLAKRGRRESDGDQPAEHKFGSAEHERAVVLFLHWIRRQQLAGGRVRSIESAQFRAAGAALHVFAGALELEDAARGARVAPSVVTQYIPAAAAFLSTGGAGAQLVAKPPPLRLETTGAHSGTLWRVFECTFRRPGERQDDLAALTGPPRGVVTRALKPGNTALHPAAHVAGGLRGTESPYFSTTASRTRALAFAMFAHAKASPIPGQPVRSPRHGGRAERGSELVKMPKPARDGFDARRPSLIVEIDAARLAPPRAALGEREARPLRLVRLDSSEECRNAGVVGRDRVRALRLAEVLVEGELPRRAVRRVFAIDLARGYGRRLPRFKHDYFGMVSPKADGSPGYDRYCEMLLEAYERDGAVRGEDGEVELPEEMWAEFEANWTGRVYSSDATFTRGATTKRRRAARSSRRGRGAPQLAARQPASSLSG